MSVLLMTLIIWWWDSRSVGALRNAEYPFIAIAPWSTLARTGSTRFIYRWFHAWTLKMPDKLLRWSLLCLAQDEVQETSGHPLSQSYHAIFSYLLKQKRQFYTLILRVYIFLLLSKGFFAPLMRFYPKRLWILLFLINSYDWKSTRRRETGFNPRACHH